MVGIEIILVFIFGLIIGSFLNVVIYRFPQGESLITPGSHCVECGEIIRFYDNIPVISFFLLKAKCRKCKRKISWRYPFIEALTAFLLVLIYIKYGFSEDFIITAVLTLFLIPISMIDIDRGLILNKLVIPCFLVGIIMILTLQFEHWINSLYGVLTGGIFFLILALTGKFLFKKESIGMGDAKLLITVGVYIGLSGIFLTIILCAFISGAFVITGFMLKKIHMGDKIPFGPFIAISSVISSIYGDFLLKYFF